MQLSSPPGWHRLPDHQQLEIASSALRNALDIASCQAELLADELESGLVPDRGGADALRLFAAVLRLSVGDGSPHQEIATLQVAGRA